METVLGAYAEVNFKSYKLDVGGFYLERRSHRLKRDASLVLAIDTKPAVTVLWSNEPISNDLLKELARLRGEQNEVTIKCSEKTLAKVKEWMSKKFPNLPYTDWYYEQAKRTVIRSAPQFTVCAATGNRIELKYAKIAVPSKEFMWVGAATGNTVFVPSASALKRGLPSHIELLTEKQILEESPQTLQWAESIATGEQAVEAVFQMAEYLQRNSDKLLDRKELDRVREVLLSARKRAVRLHNRMSEVRSMAVCGVQVLPPCAYREMEFSHEGSTLKLSDAIKMGNEVIRKIVTDGDKLVMLNTAVFVQRLAEGDKLAEKLAKLLKLA
jgi:BMFP domain-containing protein YqiC